MPGSSATETIAVLLVVGTGELGSILSSNNKLINVDLPVYRKAADIIENSNINYTILRPAWLTDTNEIDYEITHKTDQFKGTEVSRKSVAAVAVNIAKNPKLYLKDNIGISKPNTNFNKPRWK